MEVINIYFCNAICVCKKKIIIINMYSDRSFITPVSSSSLDFVFSLVVSHRPLRLRSL